MASAHPNNGDAEHNRWINQRARCASALIKRLGPDGVEWLDRFLADYVFAGEPLDQVMVKAREMGGLPPRSKPGAADDD